jgi:hypothetical protein
MTVSGSGTASDPFVLTSTSGLLTVQDTTTVNLTLSGSGTAASPYLVSADATVRMTQLVDVDTSNTTVGYVVARQTGGTFAMVPSTTAPAGAINHDTSLSGDGSAGNQLKVVPDTELAVSSTGVALNATTRHLLVRQFADSPTRAAATNPAPLLNDLSSISAAPGVLSWYDGTAWHPVNSMTKRTATGQLFAITGPYVAEAPIQGLTKLVTGTTDGNGQIVLLTSTDLATANGVLDCQAAAVNSATPGQVVNLSTTTSPNPNQVVATVFHADTGAPWTSLVVTLSVAARLY